MGQLHLMISRLSQSQVQKICSQCQIGTYAFFNNQQQCFDCPKNSECLGGSQIELQSGFWRSSNLSSQIHQCMNTAACLGGLMIDNNPNQQCQLGYGGNLCDQCVKVNGIQFTRSNKNECEICPESGINIIFLQAIILIFIYLIILVVMNIKSRKTSEISVIMRIMTNFLQLSSSTYLLQLEWPKPLEKFLGAFNYVGQSVYNIIYFDCVLDNSIIDNDYSYWHSSNNYHDDLLYRFYHFYDIKKNFTNKIQRLVYNYGNYSYLFYSPNSYESSNKLILLHGNRLGKIFLVMINVFLQTQISIFKCMVLLLVFLIIYRFQIRLQPYQNPLINELEKREMMCLFIANKLRHLTFLQIKAINIDEKLSKDSSKILDELFTQEILKDKNCGILTILSTNNYKNESHQSRGNNSQYITVKSKNNLKKSKRKSENHKNNNLAFQTLNDSKTNNAKGLNEKDLEDIFSKPKENSNFTDTSANHQLQMHLVL
ncbi:UNKNOWN [Stylonychia lemnae]|uniref:Transmembrane protein n=1 Tax=Stylonychia lemnae TaxID=5949 RepID=A0A078AZB1_STYLE|nr:UNKNOWN [Stylonychia lemnae]|eukprot:CDW87780.1 UNKNOWN [Stylonychia lemnae]